MQVLELPPEENAYYEHWKAMILPKNCIFVFGSNLRGAHGASAALEAKQKYGAIYGRGVGHQNQSYAIPTKDASIKPMSLELIQTYVDDFIHFNLLNDHMYFYLTPIGTGLAGYKHEDIAPMFKGVKRCWIPEVWKPYI